MVIGIGTVDLDGDTFGEGVLAPIVGGIMGVLPSHEHLTDTSISGHSPK